MLFTNRNEAMGSVRSRAKLLFLEKRAYTQASEASHILATERPIKDVLYQHRADCQYLNLGVAAQIYQAAHRSYSQYLIQVLLSDRQLLKEMRSLICLLG